MGQPPAGRVVGDVWRRVTPRGRSHLLPIVSRQIAWRARPERPGEWWASVLINAEGTSDGALPAFVAPKGPRRTSRKQREGDRSLDRDSGAGRQTIPGVSHLRPARERVASTLATTQDQSCATSCQIRFRAHPLSPHKSLPQRKLGHRGRLRHQYRNPGALLCGAGVAPIPESFLPYSPLILRTHCPHTPVPCRASDVRVPERWSCRSSSVCLFQRRRRQ